MRLKQYAVTVMDNWTRMRTFWTYKKAKAFHDEHRDYATLFMWVDGEWRFMIGPDHWRTFGCEKSNDIPT